MTIINFLLTNWKLILMCLILVLELIILLLKKKPNVNIQEIILKVLPNFISQAEKFIGAGNGEEKKDFVVSQVLAYMNQVWGIKADTYKNFIKLAIEDILNTPQKKGDH